MPLTGSPGATTGMSSCSKKKDIVMMRMMFSLMDADGDGAVSLQEFQAAHERIFKGMDANKDGRLTQEEIRRLHTGCQKIGSATVEP